MKGYLSSAEQHHQYFTWLNDLVNGLGRGPHTIETRHRTDELCDRRFRFKDCYPVVRYNGIYDPAHILTTSEASILAPEQRQRPLN